MNDAHKDYDKLKEKAQDLEFKFKSAARISRHAREQKGEIGRATSELQSHHDLVCRLLLEKKNTTKQKKKIIKTPAPNLLLLGLHM